MTGSIFVFGNEWYEANGHLWAVAFPRNSGRMAMITAQRRDVTHHPNIRVKKGELMNISQRTRNENGFPLGDDLVREREEEARKIRRLQVMISMVMSVIGQDPNMTIEEASELAAGAKRAALAMFPDKELAFDLLYRPRLQRLIRERFRLQ